MDTLTTDDLFDASWLPDTITDIPDLSPEDEAMVAAMMERAKATRAAKAKLRASRRKKEDPASSPSRKISIRILRSLLDLLKEQAALHGVGYQTHSNMLLYDAALRWNARTHS